MCRWLGHIKHRAVAEQTIQPAAIAGDVARLGDPVAIFAHDNDRYSNLLSAGQNCRNAAMLFRGGGERIRIENQFPAPEVQTSASTSSKASSISRLIRRVSLRRSLSFPRCFIQGFRPVARVSLNLSSTASVTNWRRGMPLPAAFDFARRQTPVGISKVVFIKAMLPYLWDRVNCSGDALKRPYNYNHGHPKGETRGARHVVPQRGTIPPLVWSDRETFACTSFPRCWPSAR